MAKESEDLEQRSKELRVADCCPTWYYTLGTLNDLKVLDFPAAVRISGQELTIFDDDEKRLSLLKDMQEKQEDLVGGVAHGRIEEEYRKRPKDYRLHSYVIDSDLVAKLKDANVQVPEDRRAVFGDSFSKIVAYNSALTKPILTDADGASPEFREALYSWHQNLDPFTHQTGSAERFAKAKSGDGLELVWGLAAYMKESLVAGRSREEVSGVIDKKLGELLGWDSYFGTTPDTPYGRKIAQELSTVRANSALVFENYRRVDQFRDQFRDQLRTFVDLYSGSQWRESQATAHKLEQFLRK